MPPTSDNVADATKDAAANSTNALPQFPGEDLLAHAGTQWKEAAETRLSALKLLHVAQGGMPPAVLEIIDVDLTDLPSLPAGHRDHHRREETRIKVMALVRSLASLSCWLALPFAASHVVSIVSLCRRVSQSWWPSPTVR